MIFNRAVHWARTLDTRWQRTWNPERRRVLINAALPMEYAMIEPVYKRMRGDSRVEFYFTSTTHPDEMNHIFADTDGSVRTIPPAQTQVDEIRCVFSCRLHLGSPSPRYSANSALSRRRWQIC